MVHGARTLQLYAPWRGHFLLMPPHLSNIVGVVLTTREHCKLDDRSYLMRLGENVYVDARTTSMVQARFSIFISILPRARADTNIPRVRAPNGRGRFINDCRHPLLYNVRFDKVSSKKKFCLCMVPNGLIPPLSSFHLRCLRMRNEQTNGSSSNRSSGGHLLWQPVRS